MKYCPEMVKEFCEHLEEGGKRTDACEMVGIVYDTFLEWFRDPRKPEFAEAVKKAEARWKLNAIKRIHRAGARTWQANAWLLERKFPEEYALRVKNQLSGPNGGPIPFAPVDVSRFNDNTLLKLVFGNDGGKIKGPAPSAS